LITRELKFQLEDLISFLLEKIRIFIFSQKMRRNDLIPEIKEREVKKTKKRGLLPK
jgi:hypothetical protein